MRLLFIIALSVLTASCAYTTAKRVDYTSKDDGFRVYDPIPLLIVTCSNAQLVSVPDFSRGYAVEFGAFLAKNDSNIKISEGQLTEASAKLDDTAFLTLIQALGEKALENAKNLAALGAPISGPIPGMEGVWRLKFNETGQPAGIVQLQKGSPCTKSAEPAVAPTAGATGPQTPFPN